MSLRILGTGSYLPPKIVTNDDLAKSLDTNDEWIHSHTGIHARHVAGEEDTTSAMAVKAAKKALEAAKVDPADIGLVVVATSTSDYNPFPSTACLVQHALGCTKAGACDLQAACAGFIYALEQARCWALVHKGEKVLVIGSETLSRIVDWKDRSICILFGDGAGAVVLGHVDDGDDSSTAVSKLISDGSGYNFITRTGGTLELTTSGNPIDPPKMTLQGHAVFNFAVKTMSAVVTDLCAKAGIATSELDKVYAHQANGRIIEATSRRMALPLDKFYMNIASTGNTSAASIPIALDDAVRSGELKDGQKVCLVGFGAGLVAGGTLMTWPKL